MERQSYWCGQLLHTVCLLESTFTLHFLFIYFHFGLILKQPLETKLWGQLKANGGDSHHIISCDISVQQITVQY